MHPYLESASALSERIQHAADQTARAFANEIVSQETTFTDRMLGRIDSAVDGFERDGVIWRARTLTDRGRSAEEAEFGADFAGVFHVAAPDLLIQKGFLAQAKLLDVGATMTGRELDRLREQCNRMLEFSPDSFVFLYSRSAVRVVSAFAVSRTSSGKLDELGAKSVADFYMDHFRCFIGDPALSTPTPLGLAKLRRQVAPRLLFVTVMVV